MPAAAAERRQTSGKRAKAASIVAAGGRPTAPGTGRDGRADPRPLPPGLGRPRGRAADPLPARRLPAGLHRPRRVDQRRTSSSPTSSCSRSGSRRSSRASATASRRSARAGRSGSAAGSSCADVFAGSFYPKLWASGYEASTHAVTAAKFAEYALLALSVPLLVRARRDARVGGRLAARLVGRRHRGRGRADLRRRHPRGVDGRSSPAVVPRRTTTSRRSRARPSRSASSGSRCGRCGGRDRRSSPSPASRAASG